MADLRAQYARLLKQAAALQERAELLLAEEVAGGLEAKEALALSKQVEGCEKRVARLLRAAAAIEATFTKRDDRARKLARSRRPQDRGEVVLRALGELPADMQLRLLDEARKRLESS